MPKDLNKVMVIGRLGRDPEMRYTQGGSPVTTFNVATSRQWRHGNGENREETEWFNVVAWNKLGEICNEFLRKASRVYIEGRLQTRQWQDQNGQPQFRTEVVATDMIILDGRNEGRAFRNSSFDEAERSPWRPGRSRAARDIGDEDIPL